MGLGGELGNVRTCACELAFTRIWVHDWSPVLAHSLENGWAGVLGEEENWPDADDGFE